MLNAYFLTVPIFYKNRIRDNISSSIQIVYPCLTPIHHCFVSGFVCKPSPEPLLRLPQLTQLEADSSPESPGTPPLLLPGVAAFLELIQDSQSLPPTSSRWRKRRPRPRFSNKNKKSAIHRPKQLRESAGAHLRNINNRLGQKKTLRIIFHKKGRKRAAHCLYHPIPKPASSAATGAPRLLAETAPLAGNDKVSAQLPRPFRAL